MARYQPPEQSRFMQIVDIVFLVAAIFGALWLPLALKLAVPDANLQELSEVNWETLKQNEHMIDAWTKLGFDANSAYEVIQTRFDYNFSWAALLAMVVVVLGYFILLFKASETEYREVIDEKFNQK